jgi:dipeptidyl aminopeptidase/acylaminoacyl peptidase
LSQFSLKDSLILKMAPAVDLKVNEFKAFSPIYFVTSDDSPTLIIHGDKDPGVPISQGKSMYEALKKAGVESKFTTIPGVEHGFFEKDADLALAETISWFEQHLVEK